ncbi:MAG: hypothetical protein S4CHLAM6_02010 [Chlamydiae bacterium]|nr:hypothetical protein [Chlamydiota bacterium]
MPTKIINNPAAHATYPRIESSSSSKTTHVPGSDFFKDVYYSVNLVSNLSLYIIDRQFLFIGLLAGSAKPVCDFLSKGTVSKKGNYEENEQHVGQLMVANKRDKNYTKKLTYLAARAIPILIAQQAKKTNPAICHAITFMLSVKTGFSLAQKAVQWLNPPPKK